MTSTSLHPTPSSQTIATEEFRAVGLAIRTEAFFFVGALILFVVLIVASAVHFSQTHEAPHHMGFTYGAAGSIPMFLVGLLIPFGIWRSEDPSRRAYFWSTPIARGPHTIMKLLSGWGWLMIATVLYLLFIVAMAITVPMITGEAAWQATTPGWEWVAAFTASTLGYLLTSIVVIGSDHPWRWIGGVLIGYGVLLAVLTSFGMGDVARAINTITDGSYGLKAALFGSVTGVSGSVTVRGSHEVVDRLSMGSWMIAMPLWIVCSAIAVTIASHRHHE
jgi:hypothetical protein